MPYLHTGKSIFTVNKRGYIKALFIIKSLTSVFLYLTQSEPVPFATALISILGMLGENNRIYRGKWT